MEFTVTLNSWTDDDVTVMYTASVESGDTATLDNTDPAGADFTEVTGTVTLESPATSATFVVGLNPDSLSEHNETFTVTLSDPVNGILASDPTATGDDPRRRPRARGLHRRRESRGGRRPCVRGQPS